MVRSLLSNAAREQWIDNDDGLYLWWQSSMLSKRRFIKENREQLDQLIRKTLSNERQTHRPVTPETRR